MPHKAKQPLLQGRTQQQSLTPYLHFVLRSVIFAIANQGRGSQKGLFRPFLCAKIRFFKRKAVFLEAQDEKTPSLREINPSLEGKTADAKQLDTEASKVKLYRK